MIFPLLALAACASSVAPPASPARAGSQEAEANGALVTTRVRRAALFKNGLAFVRREAEVPGDARAVRLEALPAPVHGTFWLAADPERLALGAAVARKDVVSERVPALTVEQLLRANVGRRLTLALGDDQALTGTLLAMPEPDPSADDPTLRGFRPPTPRGELLLLDTGTGTAALAPGDVRRVLAEGEPLERSYQRQRVGTSLTLSLTPKGGSATLALQYLERGLTWVPSYAIDVSDPTTARLTAKAEVINEAEDLAGATLEFVTGYPNLQFSQVVDPIALRGDLDAFLAALGQPAPEPRVAVMAQSVMSNYAAPMSDAASFPVAGAPAEGTVVEDLFFYAQADVTLKRGERGLYPLFSLRVPYEHLYEWDLPDTVDARQTRQSNEPVQQEIWHSVRLTNDATVPWTTAPAMTMKDGNLLGQDTLHYAAVGGQTTVRITRAVDVQAEAAEFEVARDRGAASFYGSTYDKVTVRGELRVVSHKREAVRLEIEKRLQGEVTKNPASAKVVAVAEGLRKVNPSTRLTWSLPLVAGESAEITYEYTLFVRS